MIEDGNENHKFYQILTDKIGGLWNRFFIVCNKSIISLSRLAPPGSATYFEGRPAAFKVVGTLA